VSQVPSRADVVVLGAGPAGSFASGLLAQKGFEVVLLEKEQFPRPQVGESLLPHFWKYTDMLGDATRRIEEARFVRKTGVIAMWNGRPQRTRFRDFGHKRTPLHVDRDLFDDLLLQASVALGTRAFQRTAALEVRVLGEESNVVRYRSPEGEGEIMARYVVDATGQSALVAKQMGFRVFDEELRFTSLWGYFDGGRYLDFDGQLHAVAERHDTPPVTFVSGIGDWGWSWHIVLKGSTSVGVTVPPGRLQALRGGGRDIEEKLLALIAQTPVTRRLLDGATLKPGTARAIRDYAYRPTTLAVGDCYLVGDAAAFIDPINSSGITFGIYAGYLAAWSIGASLVDRTKREWSRLHFEKHYRDRLHVFRLVALPIDRPLATDEAEAMKRAFQWFSDQEKQLALTTTILTGRPDRVRAILKGLDMPEASIVEPVDLPAELLDRAG
jgi:flavin-dependent dehydrogenase